MIPICTTIENIIHPAQLREDEYVESDGLVHCSKCRTPRQKRIAVMGRTIEPRCLCKCQQADRDKREQERTHQEFLDMVARNRSIGLPDPELRRHTFENDLGYNPKQITMAKRYVQHWEEFKKDSTGLLLWGNVGTGKSFIAGCLANALLDKGVPVIMTNFARLLNKLTDMFTKRNASLSREIKNLQEAEADLLQKKESGAEANQAAMDIIPTAQHILDNYDILTIEEKNRLWKLVLKKITIYRSPDDDITIRIHPNLPK